MDTAILLISCPDRKGLTARITGFVTEYDGNIVHADQHIDMETNTFFMRMEWDMAGFALPREEVREWFQPIADTFEMTFSLYFSDEKPRVALFCSKQTHCLVDLLTRYQANELPCEIPLIVSNHQTAASLAAHFEIPFYSFAIDKTNKAAQEEEQLALLREHQIDTIVLARYMQILSSTLTEAYPHRIINIHHSFLPAFSGSKPYHQAYARGVKLVGATAHYATENLDEGPIIEQATQRVSHSDSVRDMQLKGKDVEKTVLARALRLHLDHKILTYNNKTVIFD